MADNPNEKIAVPAPEPEADARKPSAGSPTRGFLFADLRDYTRYLESHGAADAADLLVRYRSIVRDAVTRYDGAEIKTEGDSFYVVFPAVSAAVQCGLAIVRAAGHRAGDGADDDVPPIPVGIGVHAGETIETPDGYVGTAVNVASRICALARPGEVLVSDTVRALTQTVLPVTFASRGRRALKGVTEPVAVFAVAETADAWAAGVRRSGARRRRWFAAVGAVVVVALVAGGLFAWGRLHPTNALPPGTWMIGTDFPITGSDKGRGIPINNGISLAIADANAAGGVGGAELAVDARDDAGPKASEGGAAQDPDKGVANVNAFIANPRVVAMIGPAGSKVAMAEVPVGNAAGLLQCSPANTSPALTKPRFGALDLRSANPTRISYVRLATVDDIQGPAAASYAYRDLAARTALVIDDTQDFGRQQADAFQKAYQTLGGTTVRRSVNADSIDLNTALGPLSGAAGAKVVYFGGVTDTGAAAVRKAMFDRGFGAIPFISSDGILDGTGGDNQSFINRTGAAAAANAFATRPSIAPVRADFEQRYRDTFGSAPDEFAGAAYACTQVVIESLRQVAKLGPSAGELREAVRAWAVDPSHRFDTVLGTLGFDANGDSTQQIVTFYRVDAGAAAGKGDWIVAKQQDFGPSP